MYPLRMRILTVLALVATCALPTTVLAGGYLGGNLGYYRFDSEDFPSSDNDFEDDRVSWKVQGGIQANRVAGFEAGFVDFGKLEDDGRRFDSDGLLLATTITLPLSPDFAPYGKLGQLFWDAQRRGTALTGGGKAEGEDFFYGVGLRLGVAPNMDLRLEYERYTVDEADVDMASLGLNFTFD